MKEDKIRFLENFKPLHSKGINTPLKDRKFPIGIVCAIVGKYSIEDLPLYGEETEIERHEDVFEFLEYEEHSPWYKLNIMEVLSLEPIKCDYNTLLCLMSDYIQNIRFQ